MGQHINNLSFSQATGGVNVTTPASPNQAPPGYYMLFILNGNGVPSIAKFVRLDAAAPATPPVAPTNLTASAVPSSQINLAWTDNATNETGFKIERCQGAGCTNFAQIATVGAGVTTYANGGLTASTTYQYRVRAYNAGGDSAYSNTATATTLPLPPAAPTNLTATAAPVLRINLAWSDNSNNEDGFRIERSTDGVNFAEIATVAANVTTYTDTNVVLVNTYTYRVRAYNTGGNSGYSNTASARPVVGATEFRRRFAMEETHSQPTALF
jgi:hypothetical protein